MRLESKVKISRLAKYSLVIYIMLSSFYATSHYFSAHHVHTNIANRRQEPSDTIIHSQSPLQPPPLPVAINKQTLIEDKIIWPGSKGSDITHEISQDFLKSKLFSSSMGLDNVTPYYFKASRIDKTKDITLATLVTRNRFHVLSRLATNYKGPISAAVHVLDNNEKQATIKELGKIYSSNKAMQQYVDVHLIIDGYDRQFNLWRNIAKLFTRTDYVMMLDVDFHLCTDLRKSVLGDARVHAMLASGKTAIVVPAFEYVEQRDGVDWRRFPRRKDDVVREVQDGKLDSFHSAWTSGHGATNYSRWYDSTELYPVTEYEYSYEPYIIYKKEGSPWCDERFIGYGANKAACLFEIFISGVDYWVLPNDFLIHQSHKYANHDRTRERVHNKSLYDSFRTEICLRYSRKYVIEDIWYTPAADNMKKVCTDIPKWKYLSGISKEQRLKDLEKEAALKAMQENNNVIEEEQEIIASI
ncbi:MAG: glycosyl-transferase for dystroglycan-domain-containing protein [Benjaminiella poitrasii]|nr:MAG: glycosyl-transferase for dystroglycan-domain-containing protein [Benjaminiella poitrasii]